MLLLHGANRRAGFAEIDAHDLVLTTYPLLPRDLDILSAHAFHLLILTNARTASSEEQAGSRLTLKLITAIRSGSGRREAMRKA